MREGKNGACFVLQARMRCTSVVRIDIQCVEGTHQSCFAFCLPMVIEQRHLSTSAVWVTMGSKRD